MITGMAAKPMLFMQILENHGINGIALSEATIGQQITLDVVLENSGISKQKSFLFVLKRKVKIIFFNALYFITNNILFLSVIRPSNYTGKDVN